MREMRHNYVWRLVRLLNGDIEMSLVECAWIYVHHLLWVMIQQQKEYAFLDALTFPIDTLTSIYEFALICAIAPYMANQFQGLVNPYAIPDITLMNRPEDAYKIAHLDILLMIQLQLENVNQLQLYVHLDLEILF